MSETDQQLIELVEQKTPDELTLDQIELLHRRLAESPALREVLYEQLRMEQYLSDALGRVQVSLDSIFAQATEQRARKMRMLWLGFGACLLIGVGVWIATRPDNPDGPVADREPAEEELEITDEPAAEPGGGKLPERLPAEGVIKTPGDRDDNPPRDDTPQTPENPKPAVGPWSGEDQLGGPPIEFDQLTNLSGSDAPAQISTNLLKQWLVPVPDRKSTIRQQRTKRVAIDGTFRLAAPWPDDAMLRLTGNFRPPEGKGRDLRVCFWNDTKGVQLRFSQHARFFGDAVAYSVVRKGKSPTVDSAQIVSSGIGKYWRVSQYGGPIDVRHQKGELVFSRAGIRLASAPLEEPPKEVIFEGFGEVHDLRMLRTTPIPPDATKPPVVAADYKQPSKLNWKTTEAYKSTLSTDDDGSVRVAATEEDPRTLRAWFDLPATPKAAVREWLFEVDSAGPGAGIYLGTAKGQRMFEVRVASHQKTENHFVLPLAPGDMRTKLLPPLYVPEANVGRRFWLRLMAAGTYFQAWVSRDGVRWARCGRVGPLLSQPVTNAGIVLFPLPQGGKRQVVVRRVLARGYPMINAHAQPKLLEQANQQLAVLAKPRSYDQWQAALDQTRPKDTHPQRWASACAVAVIAAGVDIDLLPTVARQLLENAIESNATLDAKLQLFDELAIVSNGMNQMRPAFPTWVFHQAYESLLAREFDSGNDHPFDTIAERALRIPMVNFHHRILLTDAARQQLVRAVAQERWQDVRRLGTRLQALDMKSPIDRTSNQILVDQQRFRHYPDRKNGKDRPKSRLALEHVVQWSQALAARALDDNAGAQVALNVAWRHPLQTTLGKAEFNILAELESAIDGGDFEDACRVMTSSEFSSTGGLLPAPKDKDLWLSFPVLIDRIGKTHPQLRRTMREKFGERGMLRARSAIVDGDAETLTNVTMQFFGTPAASIAHQWTGDRALAAGEFARALRHYEQARESASVAATSELAARERLAWAMLGKSHGEPPTKSVTLGDVEMSPKKFEQLVAEMIAHRHRDRSNLIDRANTGAIELLKPVTCKVRTSGVN